MKSWCRGTAASEVAGRGDGRWCYRHLVQRAMLATSSVGAKGGNGTIAGQAADGVGTVKHSGGNGGLANGSDGDRSGSGSRLLREARGVDLVAMASGILPHLPYLRR
jgi:hypothetical protein